MFDSALYYVLIFNKILDLYSAYLIIITGSGETHKINLCCHHFQIYKMKVLLLIFPENHTILAHFDQKFLLNWLKRNFLKSMQPQYK